MRCRGLIQVLRSAPGAAGVALACALLLAPGQSRAQCATTGTNQTCTNQAGTTVSGGATGINDTATLTVTNFGTISGTANGIIANIANVTNSGTISGNVAIFGNAGATIGNTGTISGPTDGIIGNGTATFVNSGTISGGSNIGILFPTAIVTNSGTISGGATGISATTATVTNSGTISGGTQTGITATTAIIMNSGTISGATDGVSANLAIDTNSATISGGSAGIAANIATIANSGTISSRVSGISARTVTGTNSGTISGGFFGIFANFVTLTNSGTITGATGIQATGPSTLVSSGAIIGTGGTAIDFHFSHDDTLAFLPSANVHGAILLGSGDSVSVVTSQGPSSLLTFTPNGPFTLNGTGPAPFVVSGSQIATLDPTPFALADKNLMDFTRGISGVLSSLGGTSAPGGPISTAFAPSEPGSFAARVEQTFASIPALAYADDQTMVFKAPTMVSTDGRAIWARGFGGERTQDADGALLAAHTTFYGGAVGFDMVARPDLRLGLFVGGGQSRLEIDQNAGDTKTDTTFGGVYGRWSFAGFAVPSFLDFALHGGGSTNTTSRTINSNVAPFMQVATASYDSSYVSPEFKYGIELPLWREYTLTPSLGLRYVAGFFGGYTETGSAANLTVANRAIQDLEERGELKLTRATPVGPDLLLTSVHIGAIGLERMGDTTVNAVLLGANLPFVTPGRNDVAGVVGGGGFEWRTREGVSLFGTAEAIGFSDQSTVWDARGGVRVAF